MYPFNGIISIPKKTKIMFTIGDFTILRHINATTIDATIYTHSVHTRLNISFP